MATHTNISSILMTDEVLRKPRRKRCGRQVPLSPFPIPIQTITHRKAGDDIWYYYFGLLKSDHVAVYRKGDLAYLYQMGFFGKGMLSKSQPQYDKFGDLLTEHANKQRRGALRATLGEQRTFLQERLRQHAKWADDAKNNGKEGTSNEPNKKQFTSSLQDELSGVPDEIYGTDGEDSEEDEHEAESGARDTAQFDDPCSVGGKRKLGTSQDDIQVMDKVAKLEDPYQLFEYLQLTFEEAFFLSYGLGCLSVEDEGQIDMNIAELWTVFSCRKDDFVAMYTAYHHFRSKGWIVRSSNLFGADFVLYKDGMPFYHASYSVFVKFVDEDSLTKTKSYSWKDVSCMCRVNEKIAKEVLVCYVIKPKGISADELKSPEVMKKLKVMEMVIRRWLPEKHRDLPPVGWK